MSIQRVTKPDEADSLTTIGNALCAALGNLRVQSVSLHDIEGEILWLSEGVMGPDEHSLVLEATNALTLASHRHYVFQNMGDGRSAAFLPARTPTGELVGLVTIISESKWLDSGMASRLVTPQTTAAMRRLAIFRKPASTESTLAPLPGAPPPGPAPTGRSAEAPAAKQTGATKQPAAATQDKLHSSALRLVATGAHAKPAAATAEPDYPTRPAPTTKRRAAPATPFAVGSGKFRFEHTDFQLHVQQLLKLRSGGGTRRYEVLARPLGSSNTPESISVTVKRAIGTSELDRLVIAELLAWIEAHPSIIDENPSSFSCNLSMSSIADPKFLAFVASQLNNRDVPPGTVGFELSEHACVEQQRDVEMFIAACEKLGCYVVIDDFTLDSRVVPWLASPAMRFVKIDSRITTSAMTERLQQALVIAMSQMSKVLGISCVAKRIDTPAARQWLSAVGVDYAQGFVLEEPKPLSELA